MRSNDEEARTSPAWLVAEELRALLDAADNCPKNVGNVPGPIFGEHWLERFLIPANESEPFDHRHAMRSRAVSARRCEHSRARLAIVCSRSTRIRSKRINGFSIRTAKLLYHWPLQSRRTCTTITTRSLAAANLPTDRQSKFHRIRRTVASAVAKSRWRSNRRPDHASPRTTKIPRPSDRRRCRSVIYRR